MKTSKRILSFFLAVVMVFTACSVGLTAFAAEPEEEKVFTYINSEGEAAEITYAALNGLVDEYLPLLVGGALRETLEGIGVNVDAVIDADGADDDGLVYELLAQLSPMLIGLLGGSASAESVLGSAYNSTTDFYYSYLNDDDAAMSFWSLYKFCYDNQNSSDADVKSFCQSTLPQLQALLDQKDNAQTEETTAFNAAEAKVQELLGAAFVNINEEGGTSFKAIKDNTLDSNTDAQGVAAQIAALGMTGYDFIPATLDTVDGVTLTNGSTLGTQAMTADGVDLTPFINRVSALAIAAGLIGEGEKLSLGEACFYYYTDNLRSKTAALVNLATSGGQTITVSDNDFTGGSYTVSSGEYYVEKYLSQCLTFDVFTAMFGGFGMTVEDNAYWRAIWRTMPIMLGFGAPNDAVPQTRDSAVNKQWYADAADTTLTYIGIYADAAAIEAAKANNAFSDSDFAAIKNRLLRLGALTNPTNPELGATGVNNDAFFNGKTVSSKSVESLLNDSSISARAKHALYMTNPDIQSVSPSLVNWAEGDAWSGAMTTLANNCDKFFYSYEVNCGLNGVAVNQSMKYDIVSTYVDAVIFKNAVAANFDNYEWDNYKPSDAIALNIVNSMLNGLINQYLSPGTMIGDGISGALNELLTINIDLKDELIDIYSNLANQPVETIFKLLPILVAVVDEILVPILFNAAGNGTVADDAYYNARTHGLLMELLGGSLLKNLTQASGSTVGIGTLEWDLNYVIPAALHWLIGDNAYTYTYYDITPNDDNGDGEIDSITYNGTITGAYGTKYDNNGNKTNLVPCILNIYAADKALAGAAISDLEEKVGEDWGAVVKESLTDVAGLAAKVVDEYVADHQYDVKSYTSSKAPSNKGMNNIFVALPKIIDGIGKEFASRNNIASDWSFGVYGTNTAGFDSNQTLEDFKQLASDGASAEEILDSFVNIFINNWLNALLDILNDTISTDNFITDNLPIVASLLRGLDLFGEKSALTDILNGLFGMTRTDLCSFTLEERDNGYVGFSTMSAYFLLTNIDKIVEIVSSIIEANKSSDGESLGAQSFADSISANAVSDTISDLVSKIDVDKIVADAEKVATEKNIAAANNLIDKIDAVLSALLKNTYVDGFAIDHTDGILSAVITFVTNHLGEDLSNEMADLLVEYLKVINAENTKDGGTWNKNSGKDNCQIDYKAVYSKKELSILVSQTYALVEKLIDKFVNINGDDYKVINGAINGIYSPSAVAIRSDNVDDKIMKCLTWQDASVQYGTDLGYDNLHAGDKDVFYQDLFESLSIIPAIIGTLLGTTGYYNNVLSPILGCICDTAGVPYTETVAADASGVDIMIALKDAIGGVLAQLIETPLSTVMNVVKGLLGALDDSVVSPLIMNALAPILAEVGGLVNIVGARLSPTLANKISQAVWNLLGKYMDSAPSQDIVITLINNALGLELPSLDFAAIAQLDNGLILLYIYTVAIDVITDSNILQSLLGENNSKLVSLLSTLDADKVLNMLSDILAITQNPTEVYWTFSQYVEQETNTFSYPKGITAQDAEDAVDRLDEIVAAVFPLLQQFGVVDYDSLKALVDDKLFTNDMVTTIAKAVYGAVDGAIGFSPARLAGFLTDSSYGATFSSAATTLKKASSWDKVGTVNWGFTDNSAKAEQGFITALAALTRPINDILAFLLVEGDLDIVDLAETIVGKLSIDTTTTSGDTKIRIVLKDSVLRIFTDNLAGTNDTVNHIKIELIPILEELREMNIVGENAYESAIIPLLEAFMCDGVKTYNEYVKDYNKAKDNLVIDILNPLLGFIDDALEAPIDTITKVLPNLAYFIDNNGISQVVNNLLAPITQDLLGVLDKYGYNIDDLIKTIAGKDLGQILSESLGYTINLRLSDLNSFNVQDLVLPIVNSILESKFGITLPDFDWATIASHGTVKEVKSALKGGKNYQVIANQGEVLVAVLRYLEKAIADNIAAITKLVNGIDKLKNNEKLLNIINSILGQLGAAKEDELVKAVFYILVADPENKFFDYSGFKTKDYDFSYPETVDQDFLKILGPMLDGLISGLVDLNSLVGGFIYKDEIISSLAVGLYGAVEGVKVGNDTLTNLLAKTDIDFTTANVSDLLMNKDYGETFPSAAKTIKAAGSWSKVNKDSLSWGVTDRDSFVHALCAVLRPIYGVLDVLLNDASLGLFNVVSLPGSDGYTSTIVPIMEAFGLYNVKTQYQYRQDISKEYDAILLDIINPLLDKVEDILNAPIEMLASMLPNLSLFFANDGLLQVVENLITPVSVLLDALEPIVEVNDLLSALGVDISKALQKLGIVGSSYKFDIYDIAGSLKPIVGADNIVGVLNKVLGMIKIKGTPLGIELMPIDWYKLASHGTVIKDEASQAATIGSRIYVDADPAEVLIAVLRYLIETINYKDNFNTISELIGGLLGGNDSISDVVNQVLGMLTGDTDQVISDLCELLQTLA